MSNKIKIKRGVKSTLPVLDVGELAFTTDTKELFVGTAEGNKLVSGNSGGAGGVDINDDWQSAPDDESVPSQKFLQELFLSKKLASLSYDLPNNPDGPFAPVVVVTDRYGYDEYRTEAKAVAVIKHDYEWDDQLSELENIVAMKNIVSGVIHTTNGIVNSIYLDEVNLLYRIYLLQAGLFGLSLITRISLNLMTEEFKQETGQLLEDIDDGSIIWASTVTSAPQDDKVYGLKNGQWDEVLSGGGGGDVDPYFNYAGNIYGAKYSLLVSAWESSLIVDPLEISENSTTQNPRGPEQYPNGETEGVIIPQGVESIGNNAFRNWSSNNQPLVIPNSVTSIGDWTFFNWNSNNQPLVIPNSVTSIGNNAFRAWASNNQPLVIPNSVTSIGDTAFSGWTSNNQPLVIPNSVTSIDDHAFNSWSSNNQPLVIGDSVTSIGVYAFRQWTSNTYPLVIPNSVTSIGNEAFNNWNLVPYVEMQSITPPTLANANAFNNQTDAPIYVPDDSVTAYKSANNWSSLADRIFPISDKTDVIGDIKSALDAILGV